VAAGQLVTISVAAGQTWSKGGQAWTAAGNAADPTSPGNSPLPGAPRMALVGRIGATGASFLVGTSTQFSAAASGELFLAPNDEWYLVWDNAGSLTVSICVGASGGASAPVAWVPGARTIRPGPAAEIVASGLLALLACAMGIRRRRRLLAAAVVLGLLVPATALAQSTTQIIEYYTTDAIGSVRAVTKQVNGTWQVVARHDFMPFGEEVSPQYPPQEKRLFTGKERDSETGQAYFEARYYRTTTGRFASADIPFADARPCDPQSWSLYAYGRNNPLRYNDPTGHCVKKSAATKETAPNDICQDVKGLKADDATANHIKAMETSGGKAELTVYSDTGGIQTVGYGHKVTSADELEAGDAVSQDTADTLFNSDFLSAQNAVKSGVQGAELSQNEFNALTDLVFNVGPGVLGASMSPSLNAALKSGDYQAMSEQLKYTRDAKGVSQPGLATRSEIRKAIFLGTHKW
jgi:RHS repeat-associated protein